MRIYHNPQCSKSREALALLQEAGIEPEVVEYIHHPLSEKELLALIGKLDEPFAGLVRTKESSYKDNPFSLDSAESVAKNLAKRPELLERPIVEKNGRAVIGRPPEKIRRLL